MAEAAEAAAAAAAAEAEAEAEDADDDGDENGAKERGSAARGGDGAAGAADAELPSLVAAKPPPREPTEEETEALTLWKRMVAKGRPLMIRQATDVDVKVRGAARKSQYYQKHGGRGGRGGMGRGAAGRGRRGRGRGGRGGGGVVVTKVARSAGAESSRWGHEAHTQQMKAAYKELGPHKLPGGPAVPPGGFMSKSARERLMNRAAAGEAADAAIAAVVGGSSIKSNAGNSLEAYMNQRDAAPKAGRKAEEDSEEAPTSKRAKKTTGGTMHADQFDSDDDRDW